MLVLVTGASGYVGCHTVRAVTAAGHRVRAFVRRPEKLWAALEPLGVDPDGVDVVTGDVTVAADVQATVSGVDAVVHAAAVYETSPRFHESIRETNVAATRLVLDAAIAAGADPVVHVSSIIAILPRIAGTPVTPEADVTAGPVPGAYINSKVDSEVIARDLQRRGHPVVITYPGPVMGPYDPSLGRNAWVLARFLRGQLPLAPSGATPVTDVRDIGRLHRLVLEPGLGPRRYLAVGEMGGFAEMYRTVAAAAERRLPMVEVPAPLVARICLAVDPVNRWLPGRGSGLDADVGTALLRSGPWDDSRTREELSLDPIPAATSYVDTARWLAAAGHITPRQAGALVDLPMPSAG